MTDKITEYNLGKAYFSFIGLKIIEGLIIFILTFGLYSLGSYVNGLPPDACNKFFGGFGVHESWTCPHTDSPTPINLWGIGVGFCILMGLILILWLIIIGVSFLIIAIFIKWNWDWAKKLAETREGKEKRLRAEYIILPGDVVTIHKNLKAGERYKGILFKKDMEQYKGKCTLVTKRDDKTRPTAYRINLDNGENWWSLPMMKKSKLK